MGACEREGDAPLFDSANAKWRGRLSFGEGNGNIIYSRKGEIVEKMSTKKRGFEGLEASCLGIKAQQPEISSKALPGPLRRSFVEAPTLNFNMRRPAGEENITNLKPIHDGVSFSGLLASIQNILKFMSCRSSNRYY